MAIDTRRDVVHNVARTPLLDEKIACMVEIEDYSANPVVESANFALQVSIISSMISSINI